MDIGDTIEDRITGDKWTVTSITAAGIGYEEGGGGVGFVTPKRFDENFKVVDPSESQVEPILNINDVAERAAREICRMEGRDPELQIAVMPFPGAVLDANGHAHVPVWKTIVPDVRNYLMLTEAVKRVIRGAA